MPSTTVQTLDISPVGRVEGDLDVRVDIQNGVVVNAWTQAELFRGFEVILRDKDPQAGLVVTPRACGICGASHLTCAAWALDTAWGTTVPRNAILARNLGQIVESLQSIPRHHYGLFMIDYTNKKYSRSAFYAEAVRRWAPFTGAHYEIGVTISGRPVEIYALLGGQWPHSSYMVPGGVMCSPTLTDVTRAWSILEYFRRNWIEPVWLGCTMERYEEIRSYDDFLVWLEERPEHAASDLGMYWLMSLDVGLDQYGRGHKRYMSWGYLPHEDRYQKPTIEARNAAVIMKSGVFNGATNSHKLMDQQFTREDMTHSWYDETQTVHPFDRTTKPAPKNKIDHTAKYSWATGVSHQQDGRLETGPLARQLVAGGKHGESWQHHDPLILDMYRKMGGASVLLRHFARMHECVKLYREAERILRELRLNDPWYIKPTERDGRGWGATEAIRGALCHWIEVKGGKIKNYQIIAPTTWNVGPRTGDGTRGPIEESLVGIPIADPHDPVEVGHVCRSYDSCLVCTVHAYDGRTGEELARFFPADVTVFLVEAGSTDFGLDLTAEVARAVDDVAARVTALVRARRPPAWSVQIRRGVVHFDAALYDRFFGGLATVVLLREDASLLILPVHDAAAGGYLVKLRNRAGARAVDAADFFRGNGVDDGVELERPVVWSDERAGLVAEGVFAPPLR